MWCCLASRSAGPMRRRLRIAHVPPASPSRRTSHSSAANAGREGRFGGPLWYSEDHPWGEKLMKLRVLFAVAVAIAALAVPVAAQTPDALRKAQASFDQAQSDYLQGKY